MGRVAPTPGTRGVDPASVGNTTELATLLREGRVVVVEIVGRKNSGHLVLSIGGHEFEARSDLKLPDGQSLLLRVEERAGEVLLRLLNGAEGAQSPLLSALRLVAGEQQAVDRPLGELLRELAATLRATLGSEAARPGAGLSELRALLESLPREALGPGDTGSDLRQLLQRSSLRYEAALVAGIRAGLTPEHLDRLRSNLKAVLLNALARAEDGPVREALTRTLGGIESEQLLNVARQHSGESMIWSFPFPDAVGWTTARLALQRREEDTGEERAGEDGEDSQRLTLGIHFSSLGSIRAEFHLQPELLTVRVLVGDAALAARIEKDAALLMKRLGDGRRAVQVSAAVRSEEGLALERHPFDIRYLREHHLLDIRG